MKVETYTKSITEISEIKKNCSALTATKIIKNAKEKAARMNMMPYPAVRNPPRIMKNKLGTDTSGPNQSAKAILQSRASQTSRYSFPGG